MAATAIDLMTNEELLKRAWEEFEKRLRGRRYKCAIPPEIKPPIDAWSERSEE